MEDSLLEVDRRQEAAALQAAGSVRRDLQAAHTRGHRTHHPLTARHLSADHRLRVVMVGI